MIQFSGLCRCAGFPSALLCSLTLIALLLFPGCTRQPEPGSETAAADDASSSTSEPTGDGSSSQSSAMQSLDGDTSTLIADGGSAQRPGDDGSSNGETGRSSIEMNASGSPAATDPAEQSVQPPLRVADSVGSQQKQLARDMSPTQLKTFLSEADVELRMINNGQSGIEDPAKAFQQLKWIVTLKEEASRRLIDHADSSEKDRAIGRRGELQSLSHLASLGDLKAAEQLQKLAEEWKDDEDAEVRSDSRLVLIGFAIEEVRNGKTDAANKVVSQIETLAQSSADPDAAALMVMGQAKDALMQFEHLDEASRVRELILEVFVDNEDQTFADMARQVAGPSMQMSQAMRRVQSMMQQVIEEANEGVASGKSKVAAADWKQAIETVAKEQPDLLTTQFLAGTSLEAETVGREDLATATYDVLEEQFASLQDDRGREARTAIQARENRRSVIGEAFDPELSSTQGDDLSMADYRGKVVLVPFWSAAYPDSLMVVDGLKSIVRQYPDQVAIVGVNLDEQSTDVPAFEARQKIDFPSFRSVSDRNAKIANPTAYRFGVVSLLFVAVIDQEGKVAAIEFSGRDLTPIVENLLQ
ncbi:TlpA family protein disulfide reductase [Rhodopirellula sp. JC740]|uniref:TlpA family protein disulfide reductase n=1 Tax=Rhodopirellula halodulae TaxID=2894198 RepID=A0ABS8NKN1_9BACT|nr:TlpA disulfide reductase family protein [Rhodopirellula sp. JC740]MCC9644118.1 TlpA family protein disulfide reductase [Rhodopirellula sp. JC740]